MGWGKSNKARDPRLERTVAIKVLPATAASDPDSRARFEREARAVAALDHPHICAVYDIGREGSIDFIVMRGVVREVSGTFCVRCQLHISHRRGDGPHPGHRPEGQPYRRPNRAARNGRHRVSGWSVAKYDSRLG